MNGFTLIAAAGLSVAGSAALACGPTTPCTIAGGEYFLAMPEVATDGPVPAVFFIHGYGSSGAGVMRNTGMTQLLLDRGYAVVAPSGTKMENRNGNNWSFHPHFPQRRDELAFLTAVRDDVIANHGIQADDILLSGFSIGGSLVSYVACAAPDSFTAYAPVSGSFWRPHPESCEGPVPIFHTHGWRDGTVPLEGRVIRGGDIHDPDAFAQGNVFQAMQIWRETNDCTQFQPDTFATNDDFMLRSWTRCAPNSALEFALFPGGHSIPKGWSDMALDWYEAL